MSDPLHHPKHSSFYPSQDGSHPTALPQRVGTASRALRLEGCEGWGLLLQFGHGAEIIFSLLAISQPYTLYLHPAHPAILQVNDGASQEHLPKMQARGGGGHACGCSRKQEEEEKLHGRDSGDASACEDPTSGVVSTLAARTCVC